MLGSSEDERWNILVEPWIYELRESLFEHAELPKYHLTSGVIERLLEVKKERCSLSVAEPCNDRQLKEVVVQSGFFNFVAHITLGPSIRHGEIEEDVYVRTGMGAKILIPGSRLWRSATVTLGDQMAERIRVLPNMEGVIAEFDEVEPPYVAYKIKDGAISGGMGPGSPGTESGAQSSASRESQHCLRKIGDIAARGLRVRALRLRVWTSEGVAKANRWVCVVYDPDRVLNKAPEAGGSGVAPHSEQERAETPHEPGAIRARKRGAAPALNRRYHRRRTQPRPRLQRRYFRESLACPRLVGKLSDLRLSCPIADAGPNSPLLSFNRAGYLPESREKSVSAPRSFTRDAQAGQPFDFWPQV